MANYYVISQHCHFKLSHIPEQYFMPKKSMAHKDAPIHLTKQYPKMRSSVGVSKIANTININHFIENY